VTARGELRAGGLLAAVLARAEAFLFEPVGADRAAAAAPPPPARPVVAVRGLTAGCGASTIARGLAAVLAAEDPRGTAAVAGSAVRGGVRLASPGAARAAKELSGLGCDGVRPAGRLCLIPVGEPLARVAAERPFPLVLDVAASSPPAEGLGLADHVVLVGPANAEPSLAAAVAGSLARDGRSVDVVVNRVDGDGYDAPAGTIEVAESRFAAQMALACRGARGSLARPLVELAARCRARAPR
jgi:hypothetical protein